MFQGGNLDEARIVELVMPLFNGVEEMAPVEKAALHMAKQIGCDLDTILMEFSKEGSGLPKLEEGDLPSQHFHLVGLGFSIISPVLKDSLIEVLLKGGVRQPVVLLNLLHRSKTLKEDIFLQLDLSLLSKEQLFFGMRNIKGYLNNFREELWDRDLTEEEHYEMIMFETSYDDEDD